MLREHPGPHGLEFCLPGYWRPRCVTRIGAPRDAFRGRGARSTFATQYYGERNELLPGEKASSSLLPRDDDAIKSP